jgi:transcriptional regulator with XRE-family HTH domain
MFDTSRNLGIDIEATGKRIDKLLKENNLSTKEVSKAFNISYQSVDKWRKGRSIPEIQNLYILSRMLGVKIDDLIVGVGEKIKVDIESMNMQQHLKDMNERFGFYISRILSA